MKKKGKKCSGKRLVVDREGGAHFVCRLREIMGRGFNPPSSVASSFVFHIIRTTKIHFELIPKPKE